MLALAVGIGANTAVFTIVNGVLLRAFAHQRPGELVAIFEKLPAAPVPHFDFSAPDYEILADAARSFSGLFAYRNQMMELSGVGEPQRIVASRVSPEMFPVLGVAPALGRTLTGLAPFVPAHVHAGGASAARASNPSWCDGRINAAIRLVPLQRKL